MTLFVSWINFVSLFQTWKYTAVIWLFPWQNSCLPHPRICPKRWIVQRTAKIETIWWKDYIKGMVFLSCENWFKPYLDKNTDVICLFNISTPLLRVWMNSNYQCNSSLVYTVVHEANHCSFSVYLSVGWCIEVLSQQESDSPWYKTRESIAGSGFWFEDCWLWMVCSCTVFKVGFPFTPLKT